MTHASGGDAWLGDLLFIGSSILWAGFTLLIRHWRLSALNATAVVAVLSGVFTVPLYVVVSGVGHLGSLPVGALMLQGLIQGGIQGALTMLAYGQAVLLLGVSRAVLFPAMVPVLAVVIGIPVLNELPGVVQIAGLSFATLGLLIAVGTWRWRWK
jgi:drug/metabolite transporter (DMT)-like permease